MKLTKHLFILVFVMLLTTSVDGQIGGRYLYEFLSLDNSARITGLGGSAIAVKDGDAALAFRNPASLDSSAHGAITFQHNFYLSDIQSGYFGYAHRIGDSRYTLHAGVLYVDYGSFDQTDILGDITGEFDAGEQAYVVGMASQLNENYSVGVNIKYISSRLEAYKSTAISGDLSGMYYNPESRFAASIVINNIGGVLTQYTDVTNGELPLSIQVGISKRLKHLPFRYSIIAHHLDEWNIAYDDPAQRDNNILFGSEDNGDEGPGFADKLFRHIIFNGEFLFGKKENFKVRLGYNYLRRKELNLDSQFTLSGFSLGVGFKVNRFRLDYGYGGYHYSNGAHFLGISTQLSEFSGKRKL